MMSKFLQHFRIASFLILIGTVIVLVWHKSEYIPAKETTIPLDVAKAYKLRAQLHEIFDTTPSDDVRVLIRKTLELLDDWPSNHEMRYKVERTLQSNTAADPKETCEESWTGVDDDELYFNDVFEVKKCYRIPLDKLVTLLAYADSCDQAMRFVRRVRRFYPRLTVILATAASMCLFVPGVELYNVTETASTWIQLANASKTKYVLVGRNMIDVTSHTDIDRMLRVMNSAPNVKVVGGAVRLEPEGRWYAGCYQLTLHNFTIRIQPGHEHSNQSCAYCDYIASPFLVRREEFLKQMRPGAMSGVVPFVDFFLKLTTETDSADQLPQFPTVACVDVMFHVLGSKSSRGKGVAETRRINWTPLAHLWFVDRIRLPGGVQHQWTCLEVKMNCWRLRKFSSTLPNCCLRDLAKCVVGFLQLAEQNNISTVVTYETALAPIKLYTSFLPWDKGSDVYWNISQDELIDGPIRQRLWDEYGCKLGIRNPEQRHPDDVKRCSLWQSDSCPHYPLRSTYWHIHLNGVPRAGQPILPPGLKNPTRINIHGYWVVTDTNPGLAARNRFGDNLLAHDAPMEFSKKRGEHSSPISSQYMSTKTCVPSMTRYTCFNLDYLYVGNLQFQEND